jgi:hypothetical protein
VRWRFGLLALATVVALGACSRIKPVEIKNRKPVHAVRGSVLVGSKPATGAFVLFVPRNEPAENPDPRPRATVLADGSFTLGTYEESDGAPAGEYLVAVTWEDPESKSDRFGGRYGAGATKLGATVKEGPNELPAFQLK